MARLGSAHVDRAGPVAEALLGGRVLLRGSRRTGLGAGLDAVMLAASVAGPGRGGRCSMLGCGAGAVFLCVLARLPGRPCRRRGARSGAGALAAGRTPRLNGWSEPACR